MLRWGIVKLAEIGAPQITQKYSSVISRLINTEAHRPLHQNNSLLDRKLFILMFRERYGMLLAVIQQRSIQRIRYEYENN